jgi:hypothetical protein
VSGPGVGVIGTRTHGMFELPCHFQILIAAEAVPTLCLLLSGRTELSLTIKSLEAVPTTVAALAYLCLLNVCLDVECDVKQ